MFCCCKGNTKLIGNIARIYFFTSSFFTSDDFDGELIDCDEGTLEWISKDSLLDINLWKGDLIFLDLIKNPDQPFFSLKLTYEGGELTEAVLDGKILDID